MDKYKLTYKPFGQCGLLIQWPRMISESILQDILRFRQIIAENYADLEQIPAYNSLCLVSGESIDFDGLSSDLKIKYAEMFSVEVPKRKLWNIPVCYDLSFGIDMEEFSLEKKMTIPHIIDLHTSPVYTVYCIGFLPGFMYLGGLNTSLEHPRRKEPRLDIAKGAVGIGGKQTGVYPQQSPGGWNIIGNSPVSLFDPSKDKPCEISVGDRIKFYQIDKAEHELLSIQVQANIFELKSSLTHDSSY